MGALAMFSDVFLEPVADLGDYSDIAFSEILVPKSNLINPLDGSIQVYDLDKAAIYDERHYYPEGQRRLMNRALSHLPEGRRHTILDIGSGSGNSVAAALGVFKTEHILATDVSPSLLCILKNKLANTPEGSGRLGLACVDVQQRLFRPNSFDLAMGSAILHHLIDPRSAVLNAIEATKPGGSVIFYEPFEYGCSILKLIHLTLLRESDLMPENLRLSDALIDFLKTLNNDYTWRSGISGPPKEITKLLDDKWLFTRGFFQEIGKEAGVKSVVIYSNHSGSSDNMFEDYVAQNLWLGKGWGREVMPYWAIELVREIDKSVTTEMKEEFMIEGTVIFTK